MRFGTVENKPLINDTQLLAEIQGFIDKSRLLTKIDEPLEVDLVNTG